MEVRSHGNIVRDVIIAHVMSGDAQIYIDTNRRGKHKVIFGPAGRARWLVKTISGFIVECL